jgi:hypothetical protein
MANLTVAVADTSTLSDALIGPIFGLMIQVTDSLVASSVPYELGAVPETAFSSTVRARTVFGNKLVNWGMFYNISLGTGGQVDTGLQHCEFFIPVPLGNTVNANALVVNAAFPILGSSNNTAKVNIVCDNTVIEGMWLAIGSC